MYYHLIHISTNLSLPECPVTNCDICNTDVTKCDQCSRESTYDENASLCIVGDDGGGSGDELSIEATIG